MTKPHSLEYVAIFLVSMRSAFVILLFIACRYGWLCYGWSLVFLLGSTSCKTLLTSQLYVSTNRTIAVFLLSTIDNMMFPMSRKPRILFVSISKRVEWAGSSIFPIFQSDGMGKAFLFKNSRIVPSWLHYIWKRRNGMTISRWKRKWVWKAAFRSYWVFRRTQTCIRSINFVISPSPTAIHLISSCLTWICGLPMACMTFLPVSLHIFWRMTILLVLFLHLKLKNLHAIPFKNALCCRLLLNRTNPT